jgi:hypothetical protein
VAERCDQEIFQNGKSVAALDARSTDAEAWVQEVARRADAKVDWHYSGGIANVLHLGDAESRQRVMQAIEDTRANLNGTILRLYQEEDNGLYRAGVSELPKDATGAYYNPTTGEQEPI